MLGSTVFPEIDALVFAALRKKSVLGTLCPDRRCRGTASSSPRPIGI